MFMVPLVLLSQMRQSLLLKLMIMAPKFDTFATSSATKVNAWESKADDMADLFIGVMNITIFFQKACAYILLPKDDDGCLAFIMTTEYGNEA